VNAKNSEKDSLGTKTIIESFSDSLQKLKDSGNYSNEILKWIEQIYRLETRNFESLQFLQTYSAGMEAVQDSKAPYYGWSKYHFINLNGKRIIPSATVKMKENVTGLQKEFIAFDTIDDAVHVLANFLKIYNNAGRWFSLNENKQISYKARLKEIDTPIYDSLV
jgi:hypothetical protein